MREHIYIMGAARSGTTLLSVLLGSHPAVRARGELLHLPKHWLWGRNCSCGLSIATCPAWVSAGHVLGASQSDVLDSNRARLGSAERHRNIIPYLLAPTTIAANYLETQEKLFAAISGGAAVVDESKFVARALALSQLRREQFRFVYIVRDFRGVLHSFGKHAQRPKGLLGAAAYYLAINAAAQLAAWTRLRGRVIKVRYEDLVRFPERELLRIGGFVGIDMRVVANKIAACEALPIGHLVSGNRLRSGGTLTIKPDNQWRATYRWPMRIIAYVLCLPIQVLNRYAI